MCSVPLDKEAWYPPPRAEEAAVAEPDFEYYRPALLHSPCPQNNENSSKIEEIRNGKRKKRFEGKLGCRIGWIILGKRMVLKGLNRSEMDRGKKELINKKIEKKRRRALSVNQRLGIVLGAMIGRSAMIKNSAARIGDVSVLLVYYYKVGLGF